MGLSYIISVVSLFDEYVNDLLYLREGSCLPRYMIGFLFFPLSGIITLVLISRYLCDSQAQIP